MVDDQGEELKFIRLKTGDDVISQVMELTEDNITVYMLISPLKVVYIPSQKGMAYLQVAFMPWVFTRICSEQEFMIHAEDIMTMANVSEQMTEYYWNNVEYFTGSGEEPYNEEDLKQEEVVHEEESLESLLEAIKSTKRIYH